MDKVTKQFLSFKWTSIEFIAIDEQCDSLF